MQAVEDTEALERGRHRSSRTAVLESSYIAGFAAEEQKVHAGYIVLTNIITVPVLANYKTFCRQQRLVQRADERLGSETEGQREERLSQEK